MALIKCKECGKNISTKANVCPHCGFDITKHKKQQVLIVSVILIIIAVICFSVGSSDNKSATKTSQQQSSNAAYNEQQDDQKPESCEQSLDCLANKFNSEAAQACKAELQKLPKQNYEWINYFPIIFDNYQWQNKEYLTIKYIGNEIKTQNSSGVWYRTYYYCIYDTANRKVIDANMLIGLNSFINTQHKLKEYEVLGTYESGNVVRTTIKIDPKMSTNDLVSLAKQLHKQYPEMRYDIVDAEPKNFEEWIKYSDPSYDLSLDETKKLDTWVYKHDIAMINLMNDTDANGKLMATKSWKLISGFGIGTKFENLKDVEL